MAGAPSTGVSDTIETGNTLGELFSDDTVDEYGYADDAEVLESIAAVAAENNPVLGSLSALERAMSAYPILDTAAQFDQLQHYRDGRRAQEILKAAAPMSSMDRHSLQAAVYRGENAANALLGCVFKLVVQIAREQATRRYGRSRGMVMLEDLVAEANAALTKALDTYDPAKCPTWSLYAGKTIRDTIRNKLAEKTETSAKMPSSWWRLQRIAVPIAAELAEQLDREPTVEEMQDALHSRAMQWAGERLTDAQRQLPQPQQVAICKARLVKQGMDAAIKNYAQMRQMTAPTASLNSALSSDSDRTRGDLIADDSHADTSTFFADDVERAEAHRDLMAALDTLGEREKQIVLYRFGFVDDSDWHYTRLAPMFGVSPERIRQIEHRVLARLQSPEFTHLAAHIYDLDTSAAAGPDGSSDPAGYGEPVQGSRQPRGP